MVKGESPTGQLCIPLLGCKSRQACWSRKGGVQEEASLLQHMPLNGTLLPLHTTEGRPTRHDGHDRRRLVG